MGRLFLGLGSLCGGSLAEAVQVFRDVVTTFAGARAAERFGEPGAPDPVFLGWSLAEMGRFAGAVVLGEESLRMAQAVDQPFTRMLEYFGAGPEWRSAKRSGEYDAEHRPIPSRIARSR